VDTNDATSKFIQSVSSTVKGIQQVNYVVEHDKSLTADQKASMKQFLVYRYNPAVLEFCIFQRILTISPST
jgi:succinate dehydrogenase (ubiquinone) iron-sulfur subunit